MVATWSVGHKIKLNSFSNDLSEWCDYNPDLFCQAAKFSMANPKVTLKVFASGKIVCLGAKSELDIELAW